METLPLTKPTKKISKKAIGKRVKTNSLGSRTAHAKPKPPPRADTTGIRPPPTKSPDQLAKTRPPAPVDTTGIRPPQSKPADLHTQAKHAETPEEPTSRKSGAKTSELSSKPSRLRPSASGDSAVSRSKKKSPVSVESSADKPAGRASSTKSPEFAPRPTAAAAKDAADARSSHGRSPKGSTNKPLPTGETARSRTSGTPGRPAVPATGNGATETDLLQSGAKPTAKSSSKPATVSCDAGPSRKRPGKRHSTTPPSAAQPPKFKKMNASQPGTPAKDLSPSAKMKLELDEAALLPEQRGDESPTVHYPTRGHADSRVPSTSAKKSPETRGTTDIGEKRGPAGSSNINGTARNSDSKEGMTPPKDLNNVSLTQKERRESRLPSPKTTEPSPDDVSEANLWYEAVHLLAVGPKSIIALVSGLKKMCDRSKSIEVVLGKVGQNGPKEDDYCLKPGYWPIVDPDFSGYTAEEKNKVVAIKGRELQKRKSEDVYTSGELEDLLERHKNRSKKLCGRITNIADFYECRDAFRHEFKLYNTLNLALEDTSVLFDSLRSEYLRTCPGQRETVAEKIRSEYNARKPKHLLMRDLQEIIHDELKTRKTRLRAFVDARPGI
eukprot:Plantae.Rhodophyta-Rhodochaete_pulchella.ctg3766.p1 GENE.Plantae.Rhodophyta-Rhodochaete_pulchella.ctg3766~~Plantae.Rhodophyta-Rhodochaete_pulchella.ctg3766.p1  ORF type:complete len:622 (+),score=72.42 Plantae.Rhodophyta-Rhodochaete_pulchella.ctg3766:38-1867(+)